jgi:peptidoglycan/xylan/chitin deacetylase (PgdA/CDA1 family)
LTDPRQITLTFDDGYLNQATIAHSTLAEFKIKAYFFCVLDLLQENKPLLIDELMFWLSYAPLGQYVINIAGTGAPQTLRLETDGDRRRCWAELYPRIASEPSFAGGLRSELERCHPFEHLRGEVDPHYWRLRLTGIPEEALGEMRRYGHCIGAHSKTHAVLSSLETPALEEEFRACEGEVGRIFNCTAFSYPFGGLREVCQREIESAKTHGFTQAVSNMIEPLPGTRRYTSLFLPRLALPNSAEVAVIAFTLSGARYFLQHRRLLPQVHA